MNLKVYGVEAVKKDLAHIIKYASRFAITSQWLWLSTSNVSYYTISLCLLV